MLTGILISRKRSLCTNRSVLSNALFGYTARHSALQSNALRVPADQPEQQFRWIQQNPKILLGLSAVGVDSS